MPQASRGRLSRSNARTLDLPPAFRLVTLREVGNAVAHARAHADELGAGTLVFVGRFDLAEFAVVLEPNEPLAVARLALYAGMVALGNALAALAPPEKPITFGWPDAVYIDRGLVGGGRLAWPSRTDEHAVPEWLIFGAAIRTVSLSGDAGLHPLATALEDEGFGDAGSERLVEGFARHLMVEIDRWQERGAAPIVQDYQSRLEPEHGVRREIDDNGDLQIWRSDKSVERRNLRLSLSAPSWLDPNTGGPRL